MKYRIERIKNLIIQEVMKAITNGVIKDPRIPKIITITHLTISKDFHYCHIYFSMMGSNSQKKNAVIGLNSAKGVLQRIIADNIKLRYTPLIEFRYDEEAEKAYKVDKILYQLEQERKKRESENLE